MITHALRHCPGIGPARLKKLHQQGVQSWADIIAQPHSIPPRCRSIVVEECQRCMEAFKSDDVAYFVQRLDPQDKWRILAHYHESVSYFDIETAGLEYDAPITVIACWHRNQVHTFVENENLDDFLDLLEDVTLLASFNGNSFDVPRVLDTFHLPELPCPHLDLRWVYYHHGLRGGLKYISQRNRIPRPTDLEDVDGEEAIRLWNDWLATGDPKSRELLIRYCASDVLLLVLLTHSLLGSTAWTADNIWNQLPASDSQHAASVSPSGAQSRSQFGPASPSRLRALKLRPTG